MSTPAGRFFTYAMITVGVLIVMVAGPCTIMFAGSALFSLGRGGDEGAYASLILPIALIVGGIPLAGGITLAVVGVRTLRADRRRATKAQMAVFSDEDGRSPPS